MAAMTHILKLKKTSTSFAHETFLLMKGGMDVFTFLIVVLILIYLGFDTVMTGLTDMLKFIAQMFKKKD